MHLAYEHDVREVWVVNVGDLKPMELPISFFLDYAYNTKAWNEDNLRSYFTQWASDQFGPAHAKEVGELLRLYALYASRKKPELLDEKTYSLTNYNEADRVLHQWTTLMEQAEKVNSLIAPEYKDAYFQLVLHPIKAFGNLHQLYYAVAKNKMYAAQQNVLANQWAEKAKQFYLTDSLLSLQYNKELAGGKWSHMMDQTHIGYRSWQEPRRNSMPAVSYVSPDSAKAYNTVSMQKESTNRAATIKNSKAFVEIDGAVSMLAAHYTKSVNAPKVHWKVIPDIGREGDGVTTFPVTAATGETFNDAAPHLE